MNFDDTLTFVRHPTHYISINIDKDLGIIR